MEQLEVRSALINAIEKDCFFRTLDEFEFKEIHVAESIITEALVNLHNESILDLNAQFLQLKRCEERQDFYSLMFIYCSALPKLDCSVIDVVNVFIHLKSEDIPDADFEQAYFLFCKQNIERPKVALNYLLDKLEERHELVQSTLMAAVELDSKWVMEQLSDLAQHENSDVRRQAYLAIGRVSIEDGCSLEKRFDLLDNASTSEINPKAKSGIIRAAGFFAKKRSSLWSGINPVLEKCLETLESEPLYEAANLLASGKKDIPEDTIRLLVSYLKRTPPELKGILNHLSRFMRNTIKAGEYNAAEDLLGTLLLKNDELKIGDFEHLAHELASERSSVFLNRITTKWFLSGEVQLGKALHDVVSSTGLDGNELFIDQSFLPLSDHELMFLVQKAVGWFYLHPISAISYLLSILPHALLDTKKQIGQLIYDPLLLSYMGKGKSYLEEKLDSLDDSQVIVKQLLLDLDNYRSNILDAFDIKELRAPQREVNLYWKDFNTKMSHSINKSKKSSIMDLFTTQTILYGHDVMSHIHMGSETKRSINTMHSFSHSSELPKLSVIDPEGLEIMLRVFRTERLKNETDS
tara:strand:+ start:3237 stop:4973 length:1737 start_codon:yes stop_codon:yes gene_type:complete